MKSRIVMMLAALALMVPLVALPAGAQAPERVEEPIFFVFPNTEHGIVVFWNITRDALCTWFQGGFEGPPPVESLANVQVKETGKGALVARGHHTAHLELWELNDPGNLQDPCSDTDGQSGPWAQGSATVSATDNDLDVSGTRRNSFGDIGTGKVIDVSGVSWHLSWTFRAHCSVDCGLDFNAKADKLNLRPLGR